MLQNHISGTVPANQSAPVTILPTPKAVTQPANDYGLEKILPTNEAADLINRKPQTLRKWACLENGPILPIRINGRLAWRVSDLKKLISGAVA